MQSKFLNNYKDSLSIGQALLIGLKKPIFTPIEIKIEF
jgi:hypothetical protein